VFHVVVETCLSLGSHNISYPLFGMLHADHSSPEQICGDFTNALLLAVKGM